MTRWPLEQAESPGDTATWVLSERLQTSLITIEQGSVAVDMCSRHNSPPISTHTQLRLEAIGHRRSRNGLT